MIAHLHGTITEILPASVIIDVGGVGYEVIISAPDAEQVHLDDKYKFYTYHAIRENGEDLYGFSSLAAKRLFEMLISVNGIGPKAAINILSLGTPEEVRNAIANTDAAFISKASGVGKNPPNVSLSIFATKLELLATMVLLKPSFLFYPPSPTIWPSTPSSHSVFLSKRLLPPSPTSIRISPPKNVSASPSKRNRISEDFPTKLFSNLKKYDKIAKVII